MAKQDTAKEIAAKITGGKLPINDKEVLFELVEGDEEKNYLEKTVEEMVKRRKNQKVYGKQKAGGKNRGGRQFRKRKQDNHDDGPPKKVKADDS